MNQIEEKCMQGSWQFLYCLQYNDLNFTISVSAYLGEVCALATGFTKVCTLGTGFIYKGMHFGHWVYNRNGKS